MKYLFLVQVLYFPQVTYVGAGEAGEDEQHRVVPRVPLLLRCTRNVVRMLRELLLVPVLLFKVIQLRVLYLFLKLPIPGVRLPVGGVADVRGAVDLPGEAEAADEAGVCPRVDGCEGAPEPAGPAWGTSCWT